MTSDFVKKVHLETAQRYQAQGYDKDYLLSHFQKVALEPDDIAELLLQLSAELKTTTHNSETGF